MTMMLMMPIVTTVMMLTITTMMVTHWEPTRKSEMRRQVKAGGDREADACSDGGDFGDSID